MSDKEAERRKFRRVFFTKEDKIVAYVIFPENKEIPVQAGVMNLSEEGVCLSYEKNKTFKVRKGDILNLMQIIGTKPELSVDDLEIEVRWVMDEDYFDHDQIGCKILNPSNDLREEIKQIDSPGVMASEE